MLALHYGFSPGLLEHITMVGARAADLVALITRFIYQSTLMYAQLDGLTFQSDGRPFVVRIAMTKLTRCDIACWMLI